MKLLQTHIQHGQAQKYLCSNLFSAILVCTSLVHTDSTVLTLDRQFVLMQAVRKYGSYLKALQIWLQSEQTFLEGGFDVQHLHIKSMQAFYVQMWHHPHRANQMSSPV